MAATVSVVAEKGYEATHVSDLVSAAGVSRKTFYRHFASKDECACATIDVAIRVAASRTLTAYRQRRGSSAVRLGGALDTLIELVVSEPAAAKLCCVDIYSIGPSAIERSMRLDRLLEQMVVDAVRDRAARDSTPSREIARAILGGLRQIVQTRVRLGREHELLRLPSELREWAMEYAIPLAEGWEVSMATPPSVGEDRRVRAQPDDARARMLIAVAELAATKGYAAMTITDIAEHGQVSLTTFYKHFSSTQEALVASVSYGEELLLAETLPAFQAAPSWPLAVRDGLLAFLGFLAANPALARLGLLDVYSGGSASLEWRETSVARFQALMTPGYELRPQAPGVAAEAVGGSIAATLYDLISAHDAQKLLEMAPFSTFLALTPFVGADEARAIASMGDAD